MSVIEFHQVKEEDRHYGGKAWGLARLAGLGLPVPPGLIISAQLETQDWQKILQWWKAHKNFDLAVRSSAAAEDSEAQSFAGQNKSFLQIREEESLKKAVEDCFLSAKQAPSQAYRKYFESKASDLMNVVIQQMVQPQFSGVFFSTDPRQASKGWVLEVVDGLGEKLVSGQVTPGSARADGRRQLLPVNFSEEMILQVVELGQDVARKLNVEIDIEWAIDQKGKLFLLQARPITTLKKDLKKEDYIKNEILRLKQAWPLDTPWDGQTFSEWSGFPSYFTFSIWRNAFSPHQSFGKALEKLGYMSFSDRAYSPKDSVLERVYGRAYINLDKLSDLYYGPIPYVIELNPRPQTRFSWKKLSHTVIAHAPRAIMSMIRVSWNLSTKRKMWLDVCSKELHEFEIKSSAHIQKSVFVKYTNLQLQEFLQEEAKRFSQDHLVWPFVLVVLMESTIQRLQMLLKGIYSPEEAHQLLLHWMGGGLHTTTSEMMRQYQEASENPAKQDQFLARFGHRGPGEMDLANPRWKEIGFQNKSQKLPASLKIETPKRDVEAEISQIKSFKKEVILEEWRFLKAILELRELWKMALLKPYSSLRYSLQELATRLHLGQDIHWLRLSEVLALDVSKEAQLDEKLKEKIADRRQRFEVFKELYFPPLLTLRQIDEILSGKKDYDAGNMYEGEPLSPGLTLGVVKVVKDISQVDPSGWPDDVVLVAESTDPGWTPLFVKAKAVVIQNGGVLSHCAIVAREMGLPAVSGIRQCHQIFKDGDRLWVDGNLGRVTRG